MKTRREKSTGAIIYKEEGGRPLYLLLHYPSSKKARREYWDLPKGHMEREETEEETAQREVFEETGLRDVKLFPGFRETIHYYFQLKDAKVSKTVVFFLGETKQKKVRISHEHLGFVWLPEEEALQKLTFENARRVLRGAAAYLKQRARPSLARPPQSA